MTLNNEREIIHSDLRPIFSLLLNTLFSLPIFYELIRALTKKKNLTSHLNRPQ